MHSPESPETLFSFLYSRLPDAVRIIVYDAACKLREYCSNREPFYFKKAFMTIDRFHSNNHVGCPLSGYDLRNFWMASLYNTGVCEQTNCILAKLKTSCYYMSIDHFVAFMKWFVAQQNKITLKSLLSGLVNDSRAKNSTGAFIKACN